MMMPGRATAATKEQQQYSYTCPPVMKPNQETGYTAEADPVCIRGHSVWVRIQLFMCRVLQSLEMIYS